MANFEQKDQQKRALVRKFEVQRKFLKAVTQNQSLPQSLRYDYFLKLQKLSKKTSAVQVVNRCVFSHRSRGTLRKFKLSRIWLRELLAQGNLTHTTKSSW